MIVGTDVIQEAEERRKSRKRIYVKSHHQHPEGAAGSVNAVLHEALSHERIHEIVLSKARGKETTFSLHEEVQGIP
jgi:hypothetical protein